MLQYCFHFIFWFFAHKVNLASQPGLNPQLPALEVKAQPLDHQKQNFNCAYSTKFLLKKKKKTASRETSMHSYQAKEGKQSFINVRFQAHDLENENYGDSMDIRCTVLWSPRARERQNRRNTENFYKGVHSVWYYNSGHMSLNICSSSKTPWANPNVNYGLWVDEVSL